MASLASTEAGTQARTMSMLSASSPPPPQSQPLSATPFQPPPGYTIVTEGEARVLFPQSGEVFYNPVQELNRDLSVAVVRVWEEMYYKEKLARAEKKAQYRASKGETTNDATAVKPIRGITILEGLSATGLRAIRYAKEVEHAKMVTANDLNPEAVALIEKNIAFNKTANVTAQCADCALHCQLHHDPLSRYDVIDLDPYGSPSIFLDGAVQAVSDGGLLLITCTDMAVLAGNHAEAGFAKYGGMPLKTKCCHELALRLVLQCLDGHAARHKRYIVPLISLSIDFYVRVFVRVFTSATEAKRAASKQAQVYVCTGCDSHALQPLGKVTERKGGPAYTPGTGPVVGRVCNECGYTYKVGGPIWQQPIHDQSFVRELLQHVEQSQYATRERMTGLLSLAEEELPDIPLYYGIHELAGALRCTNPPSAALRSAIMRAGYRVSESHCGRNTVKTDMPLAELWDLMRCWVQTHPVVYRNIKEGSPAAALLAKEPKSTFDFTTLPGAEPRSKSLHLKRYPDNPQPNWGPRARAKKSRKPEEGEANDPMAALVQRRDRRQGRKGKRDVEREDKDSETERGERDRGEGEASRGQGDIEAGEETKVKEGEDGGTRGMEAGETKLRESGADIGEREPAREEEGGEARK